MPIIRSPFLDVINTSLEYGKCPDNWRTSIITPIPKVSGTTKGDEHRPVNQLPSYEKVIEGVVKMLLEEHINKNTIVIDEQFGFRENYSCELALNELIWNWKKDTDEGYIIVAISLDLKRAFETIDRNRLLKSNRTQRSKYNGVLSDEIGNDFGLKEQS